MKKQQKIEPGFIKDLRSALEVMHFTRRTKETNVDWIAQYHTFLRSQRGLDKTRSKQIVEAFLCNLAPNVAAATQNQAFNTLLFFYRNVIGTELGDIHTLRAKKKVGSQMSFQKKKPDNCSVT